MTEREYKIGDKVRMLEAYGRLEVGGEYKITFVDFYDNRMPYQIEGRWPEKDAYEHLPYESDNSDLLTNRIPFGLLDPEVQERMMAWEHGHERWRGIADSFIPVSCPNWTKSYIYRALPAPVEPERITTWHNVYREMQVTAGYKSRAKADDAAYKRLAVYRIERNEDGSDPQIFVEDV